MKVAIITGISGQDGAYLAKFLLGRSYKVIGLVRSFNRRYAGLEYLRIHDKVILELCNLWDRDAILRILIKYQPDEVYNLAAQSSVSISFQNPLETMQFNIVSVLNFLETIRNHNPAIKFYQASSSEMYGAVPTLPIKINSPMHPLSPYGISKASAFWAVVNYREAYGLKCCTGVLFNHESYLRPNHFFVKKVIHSAIRMSREPGLTLRLGNLKVKRDFGFSPKYVEAMWLMLQGLQAQDYVICSGTSVLLEDIVKYVFNKLNVDFDRVVHDEALTRPTDIHDIYGDNTHAIHELNWEYHMNFFQVLDILIEEEIRNLHEHCIPGNKTQ